MVEEISPDKLNEKLRSGNDVQVIDIRQSVEYRKGHIPGAKNIPLTEFADRIDDVEWGEEIVVACPIGQSSKQAARLLESYEGIEKDATIINLESGYRGWTYELETGPESDGDSVGGSESGTETESGV